MCESCLKVVRGFLVVLDGLLLVLLELPRRLEVPKVVVVIVIDMAGQEVIEMNLQSRRQVLLNVNTAY